VPTVQIVATPPSRWFEATGPERKRLWWQNHVNWNRECIAQLNLETAALQREHDRYGGRAVQLEMNAHGIVFHLNQIAQAELILEGLP
jgi:hypothetical protein